MVIVKDSDLDLDSSSEIVIQGWTAGTPTQLSPSPNNASGASFSSLHGLIIGIDTYKEVRPLSCCVNDANSVLDYFTQELGVPSSNFLTLFNEQATRDNIVNGFYSHLINNPRIQPFDPIVVYFAGHSDRCSALVEWESGIIDEDINMLITHDFRTRGAQGEQIWGIPDRTLRALVYYLSQAKGNNITIILDANYFGGKSRGDKPSTNLRQSSIRGARLMPGNIYEQIIRKSSSHGSTQSQQVTIANVFSSRLSVLGPGTHILLTGCRDDEYAFESEGHGAFTRALLQALRTCDPLTTSYWTLFRTISHFIASQRLRLKQTPQCEGQSPDRLLFSTRRSVSKSNIALTQTTSPGTFQIRAGNAVGIMTGTELEAFSDSSGSTPMSAPIARFVVTGADPTRATLKELNADPNSALKLPADAYAVVIKYNDHSNTVRLSANRKSAFPQPWQEVFPNLAHLGLSMTWTEPGEPSDLILAPTDNGVELQRHGATHIRLKHDLGATNLTNILAAITRFHFHLQYQVPMSSVRAQLGMKFRELEKTGYKRWGLPEYKLKQKDFFEGCLETGTVANVPANSVKLFGLTITNDSQFDLFPYVLHYNLEDYSVSCLYEPASRTMRAPLRANDSLSIGYSIRIPHGRNIEPTNQESKECGVFVLLAFNRWVDIAHLQQASPFKDKNNHEGHSSCFWPIVQEIMGQNFGRNPPSSLTEPTTRPKGPGRAGGAWGKVAVRVSISL